MAHEITNSDDVVLVGQPAWHGLGQVIPESITPTAALPRIKGNFTVVQRPLYAEMSEGKFVPVDGMVANFRDDTWEKLGLVSTDWHVWQNQEVAEFAESLAQAGDTVKIETAGMIRGGKKIWFLLRGESFSVRHAADEIVPYILVSNGHDGKTGLRCDNTTVRVVCSNTLHMVIPDGRSGRQNLKESGYHCAHTGDLKAKIEEARKALRIYEYSRSEQITLYNTLAGKTVNEEMVKQFYAEVYARSIENVKLQPTNDKERAALEKCQKFMGKCLAKFDETSARHGSNAWIMLNAFTEVSQSARKSQGARESALLFGVDVTRGLKALQVAYKVAA